MKVCVNCGGSVVDKHGNPLEQVYDQALDKKLGIIKLLECRRCGENVDKYVEYEGCLVLLDLALQQGSAFRHTLINNDHKFNIAKMVFLTLIVDGYTRWSTDSSSGAFLEREWEFYLSVGCSLASLLTFLITAVVITLAAHLIKDRRGPATDDNPISCDGHGERLGQSSPYRLDLLCTGLALSHCARFLRLGALLWATEESTQFLWAFVNLLFFLTSRNVMKVVSGLRSPHCTAISLISHASFHLFEVYTRL